MGSTLDVRLKENLRRQLSNNNMFSEKDLKKMETNSILYPFINNSTIKAIYDTIFPILGNFTVQKYFANLYEEYDKKWDIKNKKALRNLPKVLSDDFFMGIGYSSYNYFYVYLYQCI